MELTGNELKQAAIEAKETAAGTDQWYPGDFKLFSEQAFNWLARLLNAIENGADWPDTTSVARASFLAKDLDSTMEPLNYRVLLMLPTIYRLWTRVRLSHLQPWIAKWYMDCIFA